VNSPAADDPRGGSAFTFAIVAAALGLFGWVGNLPDLLGPVVGVLGLALSALWRRRGSQAATFAPLPALVALGLLAASCPTLSSTELFGSLATVGLLLWMADDPARPAGGGRRASSALGTCGLAAGLAWSMTLVLPSLSGEIGVAGGLLAGVLLLLAFLLAHPVPDRPAPGGSA